MFWNTTTGKRLTTWDTPWDGSPPKPVEVENNKIRTGWVSGFSRLTARKFLAKKGNGSQNMDYCSYKLRFFRFISAYEKRTTTSLHIIQNTELVVFFRPLSGLSSLSSIVTETAPLKLDARDG